MRVWIIDIGGHSAKWWVGDLRTRRAVASGRVRTGSPTEPGGLFDELSEVVGELALGKDANDLAVVGMPSPVENGVVLLEPTHKFPAGGWCDFDFEAATGMRTILVNDAVLAAAGVESRPEDRTLFLGFGTGLGTALVEGGVVQPFELSQLPFEGATFDERLGTAHRERIGDDAWRELALRAVDELAVATVATRVVVGGGAAPRLGELPDRCRFAPDDLALRGGLAIADGSLRVARADRVPGREDGDGPEDKDRLEDGFAWRHLRAHARRWESQSVRQAFDRSPERASDLTLEAGPLRVDFSKECLDAAVLDALVDLAVERDVLELRDRMFGGDRINATEARAVLHVALRGSVDPGLVVDGETVPEVVEEQRAKAREVSARIRDGEWTGSTGERITDVVNIGIGGSDLGPAMVCRALRAFADGPRVHFVSNVCGSHLADTVRELDPRTTLFVIASKSFTTQETLLNAKSARAWLERELGAEFDVARHFVAVSTNSAAVREFGIEKANQLEFRSWVGGRFSLWSAIGLPIEIQIGSENFEALLAGAREIDETFRDAEPRENLPLIAGLVRIWNRTFRGTTSHAVLPYDQRLERLAAYLQQAEMESNGKQVMADGRRATFSTSGVVFGEPGTNGQHAFYQWLHQGTDRVSVDFLVARESVSGTDGHHEILAANAIAQAEALLVGRPQVEVAAELRDSGTPAHDIDRLAAQRTFDGGRPSTTILYDRLDPRTLGALLALSEHSLFVQGAIWGLNSFDQWGVELGKMLAKRILPKLSEPSLDTSDHDASTRALIDEQRR